MYNQSEIEKLRQMYNQNNTQKNIYNQIYTKSQQNMYNQNEIKVLNNTMSKSITKQNWIDEIDTSNKIAIAAMLILFIASFLSFGLSYLNNLSMFSDCACGANGCLQCGVDGCKSCI